ncbi:MAG TPA: AAA family ATPase [Streptosporangiaceae bacterium]|nr:AAA family ATPase [Streptosporangiaceae bacterium]
MDDNLLDVVMARLYDKPLDARATDYLLAACEGGESLAARLRDQGGPVTETAPGRAEPRPTIAYLRSITVAGFRGIGPEKKLELEPGPGLTLIVGRNGSGKSSFAEGLEILLTGTVRRWNGRPVAWHEGWRNLHDPVKAKVAADLLIEGAGEATAERHWDSKAKLSESQATLQVNHGKRTTLDQLDWHEALTRYRPFLSHSELETFIGGPSQLYDLLASVLGLEDLAAAEKRLTAARKAGEDGLREVSKDLPALLEKLASVDDGRASACWRALSGTDRDLQQAYSLAAGAEIVEADSQVQRLRQWSQLAAPEEPEVAKAAAALRAAARDLAAPVTSAVAVVGLLREALAHYGRHGAGDCPVCGAPGAMDDSWRERTENQVRSLGDEEARALDARATGEDAARNARALFWPAPEFLRTPAVGAADPLRAWQAWSSWTRIPQGNEAADLRQLADHLHRRWQPLHDELSALRISAERELHARADRWAPVAVEVSDWCARAIAAKAAADAVPALSAAITWLRSATDEIRNDRLTPISEQAATIWSRLRQESNVDLGPIRLSGSGTRRQVDLRVTVDNEPGAALSVMSQGELNALALSIFLPQSTLKESPFRFLVIDDPVQAMDPFKVDGLARVLDDVAKTRQVLVFTHDDRLTTAVRQLGLPARVLKVAREPGSVIEVSESLSPVEGYLDDARSLCRDPNVRAAVREHVVPGLLRLAVEAAFTEAARRRLLRTMTHAEAEDQIAAASKLAAKAALALAPKPGQSVYGALKRWDQLAADTYDKLNNSAHHGYFDPDGLIDDVTSLITTIRQRAR